MVTLSSEQLDAVNNLGNGKILVGDTGSGKSLTGLSYYLMKVCGYTTDQEGLPVIKKPTDLYIITTAKKRDSLEWEEELLKYNLGYFKAIKVVIDSWNNIKKYIDVSGAFFLFDEQHLTGYGSWTKNFLKIVKKNQWILLTATPGDTWLEYAPVFIANGFYRNKTEFMIRHVVYSRYTKYPSVEKYIDENTLFKHKNDVVVVMKYKSKNERHKIDIYCPYDIVAYKDLVRNKWNYVENRPVRNISELCYLMRRSTYSSASRLVETKRIIERHKKVIVFYNFDYELENLIEMCKDNNYLYKQWNGKVHEKLPKEDEWVYLVQYISGSEAWNCTSTNVIVFFSLNYSYKIMHQAEGRIDRRNTPYKELYYYYLKSRASIDLAVSKALDRKKNFNERNLRFNDQNWPKNG